MKKSEIKRQLGDKYTRKSKLCNCRKRKAQKQKRMIKKANRYYRQSEILEQRGE